MTTQITFDIPSDQTFVAHELILVHEFRTTTNALSADDQKKLLALGDDIVTLFIGLAQHDPNWKAQTLARAQAAIAALEQITYA